MSDISLGATIHYCDHCGLSHPGPCPRIKAIEYYPDGSVKRVEYHEPKSPRRIGDVTYIDVVLT